MKNLAAFKRRLTPGVKLQMVYHLRFDSRDEAGNILYRDDPPSLRVVKQCRSKDVIFLKGGDPGKESYLTFNLSSDWEFTENTAICFEDVQGVRRKVLTYTFI